MNYHNPSVIKCDKDQKPGWFRFMGNAGSQIATSCVPVDHCGTKAPGWFNGKHPASPGEEVTGQVCYHWGNDCCKFGAQVAVRNCDDFYVYKLLKIPDVCDLRVCSNGKGEVVKKCTQSTYYSASFYIFFDLICTSLSLFSFLLLLDVYGSVLPLCI